MIREAYQHWKSGLRRPFFFNRLQWRLTRSYTVVTVAALVALQTVVYTLVLTLLLSYFRSAQFPPHVAQTMRSATVQFRPHLAASAASPETLTLLLRQFRFTADLQVDLRGEHIRFGHNFQGSADVRDFLDDRVLELCLTDPDGKILAAAGADQLATGAEVVAQWPALSRTLLQRARQGMTDPAQLAGRTPDNVLLVAAPIFDDATGRVMGVFWARMDVALDWDLLLGFLNELFYPMLWLPLLGLFPGLIFGYFTARHLTRRLSGIARAAEQWGQGDFSGRAPEQPGDELGALGERLNRMAAEMQDQIALQQRLATLEERNRLARDLHDTVKQQLFACAMQIGAAGRVLPANPAAAQSYLRESEALAKQMQEELSQIIQELQPAGQSSRSLAQNLRELSAVWTRQTGIPVALQLNASGHRYAPAIERTVLRITQEAMANIARHSAATEVTLQLDEASPHRACLAIGDNGKGFAAAETAGGFGLQSMRDRAHSLPGGAFTLDSQPQRGTRIEVQFQPEYVDET